MASIVNADWSVDRLTKNIRYIGDGHGGTAPSYSEVIELHRWLMARAFEPEATGDDEVDMIATLPSLRQTDNIIQLINLYNIDQTASEHLFDGSIIQNGGDDIWDGIVNFGNGGVLIQIHQNGAVISDDFWNYNVGGTHDGAADASVLTDTGASWTVDEWVGYVIKNTTDGSQGVITANTSTTITAELFGGTDDDWDVSDAYLIGQGLNSDSAQGISHRFMIKVRDSGTDTDGRRLIGTTRVFGKTYGEFSINGTSRGNNVLALSNADDLNNTTAINTVSGWTTIDNTTEGYVLLDVNNNSIDEAYYSEWNRDVYSINQFYERMKFITTDATTETLYGLNGELFRGITHEIDLSGTNSGTFSAFEAVSWTGGTGQMLAIDNTTASSATKMWIQLLTGVPPTNAQLITGGSSSATATASGTATDRSSLIRAPFIGQSTGSAIIGSYGIGIETTDLSASDTLFDLTNTAVNPPNNVTFTVGGLSGRSDGGRSPDRVLVAPWDGSTLDNEGNRAVHFSQFSLDTALTGGAETAVVITTSIPSDTPASGTIRIETASGLYKLVSYTSYTGSTFTIPSTDFSGDNAGATNDVFISYIDASAPDVGGSTTAQSLSFTGVFLANRDLVVIVRNGAVEPIKEYIAPATFTNADTTISAIRTADF